jgi:predicted transcriptional regulator
MNFKTAARLGSILAKDYAQDFFELLVNYQDISASEAASRLGLHIRTAQDFLDTLADLEIVGKREAQERKRPYFRYTLQTHRIELQLDLDTLVTQHNPADLARRVREKARSGANFSLARGGGAISHVSLWRGEGRDRKETRINLTQDQGRFLFHLPFPNAAPLSVADILRVAGIPEDAVPEVLDLVDLLVKYDVIEIEDV